MESTYIDEMFSAFYSVSTITICWNVECESFRDSRYERNFGAKSYNSRVTHIEVFLAFKSRLHRGFP